MAHRTIDQMFALALGLRGEWWADNCHAVLFEKYTGLRRWRKASELGKFTEEAFHLPGGLEGDQQSPAHGRHLGPYVRDSAGRKQGVARQQAILLIADFD